MRILLALTTCFAIGASAAFPAHAADPSVPAPVPLVTPSDTPSLPDAPLDIDPNERLYFELGDSLGQAAFAYADLSRQSAKIAKEKAEDASLKQLAGLAPLAGRDRAIALENFERAEAALQQLHAPESVILPVTHVVARLHRPLQLTGEAQGLTEFNPEAAQTLAALQEYEDFSGLPDRPALRKWLASRGANGNGKVWYADGLIAGLADIAAQQQMPDLLPPVSEIATDLRGLRDWLALRLPDQPTPDQIALKQSVEDFLTESAHAVRFKLPLSATLLQALGHISKTLEAQILSSSDALPSPVTTAPGHPSVPEKQNPPMG